MAQPNGPRPEMTTGRNRNTVINQESRKGDSGLRRGGGNRDISASVEKMRAVRRPPTATSSSSQQSGSTIVLPNTSGITTAFQNAGQNSLQALLLAAVQAKQEGKTGAGGALPRGLRAQLIRGFEDAGRDDLARMVKTRAFDTWIGAESGWDKNVVSPANNQGLRNGGLFQFWYGHDFTDKYEHENKFTASPYEQAQMVAKYFSHLDPADIRRYARQIRSGSYPGWG